MTMTGLRAFDETIHATNTWLHELTSRMGWDDRRKGYRALRLSLHALRDRLPVAEAAQFAAQLPTLLRGVFYEGWRPAAERGGSHDVDEFLSGLRDGFSEDDEFDAEAVFREVISVIKMHISAGEMEDVRRAMPGSLHRLFDEPDVA